MMRNVSVNKRGFSILVILVVSFAMFFKLFRGIRETTLTADVKEDGIQMYGTHGKITADGHYLPFYGYTIIAPVVDWKNYAFTEEYIKNSEVLKKFFSPLPASSYHVTIFDIFSQRGVPEKYKPKSGSVPTLHWANSLLTLKSDLTKAQKACDLFDQQIQFQPGKLRIGKTVLSLVGTLSNMGTVSKLRLEFYSIFKTKAYKEQTFHLSLGYIYRDITERDEDAISKELEGLWKVVNQSYPLQPPKVYYFETMKEFIPFMNVGII